MDDNSGIKREPLYQVWAEDTETGQLVVVPYFPRIAQAVAEEWVGLMNQAISSGKLKKYANPKAILHLGNLT